MKHYIIVFLSVAGIILALFIVAELLHIPLLTDPAFLETKSIIAAFGGVLLLWGDVVLPVPSSIIQIAMGALFGIFTGTLLSITGTVGGAVIGFFIGRRGGPLFNRLVPEKERIRSDSFLKQWGIVAVIITRPVPIIAETMVILAGASAMKWSHLLIGAVAGGLPPALLYAITGATANTLDNSILSFLLIIAVAGIFWLFTLLYNKRKKKAESVVQE